MYSPKISIIVPIYNVEQYIQQCIDSLLHQTLSDIEIILVDDGSPDNSGRIADEYSKRDSSIKVIHQSNKGLGPARNAGIAEASGEYTGFVDSDDWVLPDMFRVLYENAVSQNADISVGGYCNYVNGKIDRVNVHPLHGKTISAPEDLKQVRMDLYGVDDRSTDPFPMSVWTSIYKTELIKKNHLQFENILSEDTIFNISIYKYASVISFIDCTDYCYRKDDQASITNSFSNRKLQQFEEFLGRLNQMAENESDRSYLKRVKRTAINYGRMYSGILMNSNLTFREKRYQLKRFAASPVIKKCWADYPLTLLPMKQRVFHICLQKKMYGTALILSAGRDYIKKGIKTNF